MLRPSIRRRVERDGEVWWTRVHAGERTWAFRSEHTDVLYSVTGREADDGTVFAAAKALREGVR
jgi:hypothetical protein